jgi:conjugal transfer/entry exclusion protein
VAVIKVDTTRIDQLAQELRGLHSEFNSLESRVDDYQGAVGHQRVVDRLEELASNWSDARDNILQRLERLAQVCQEVARTYRDQEQHLASQMQSGSGGS